MKVFLRTVIPTISSITKPVRPNYRNDMSMNRSHDGEVKASSWDAGKVKRQHTSARAVR